MPAVVFHLIYQLHGHEDVEGERVSIALSNM